jgi:hypothetical protein
MPTTKLLFSFLLCLAFISQAKTQITTIQYSPTNADFANPERGFYTYSETYSSNHTPLVADDLAALRLLHPVDGANYSIYSTLVFRYYVLDNCKNGPIPTDFLQKISADFEAVRAAGHKMIPRFAYTVSTTDTGCPDPPCRPYGDASKAIVLQHIAQLKPILMANADVIAVLQMGFIGIWGENYYTDFFGDASQSPYYLTANNWNDRAQVCNALLDALPTSRAVQVRYAQMKQKFIYGENAPLTVAPLTEVEAFNGTRKSRLGFHNDCFLASEDDFGTFTSYDENGGADTAILKPYWATDTRFVPVGGETCFDNDPYSNCSGTPGGNADGEMARMHYSYLNSDYNNELNNDWVSGGCMENIKKNLGYRLVLQSGTYSTQVQAGQTISLEIKLKNVGYAAPFNPRKLRIILRNMVNQQQYVAILPNDPRLWLSNELKTVTHNLCLPNQIPNGNYRLLMHLADPEPTLLNRPEYAIRMANENVWESSTGYNDLGHTITVNSTANNLICTGEIKFIDATTSVLEMPNNKEIYPLKIFPNPIEKGGILHLQIENLWQNEAFEKVILVNTLGQIVFEKSLLKINLKDKALFPILNIEKGLYQVIVLGKTGVWKDKLVVE